MYVDINAFTDEQTQLLRQIVSDLAGPTSTGRLLLTLEHVIYALKPDFDVDPQAIKNKTLLADLQACMAALTYMKVQHLKAKKHAADPNA